MITALLFPDSGEYLLGEHMISPEWQFIMQGWDFIVVQLADKASWSMAS